jgi:hypothetical protein
MKRLITRYIFIHMPLIMSINKQLSLNSQLYNFLFIGKYWRDLYMYMYIYIYIYIYIHIYVYLSQFVYTIHTSYTYIPIFIYKHYLYALFIIYRVWNIGGIYGGLRLYSGKDTYIYIYIYIYMYIYIYIHRFFLLSIYLDWFSWKHSWSET